MTKWISIDPGGTTGLCTLDVDSRELKVIELEPEHHVHLWNVLHTLKPEQVICERFDYRRHLMNADLTAVEYIGIVNLYCKSSGTELKLQQQLKGDKGLWTNDKLKQLGLYKPGKPHAMDALRHMLYYITVDRGDSYWVKMLKGKNSID